MLPFRVINSFASHSVLPFRKCSPQASQQWGGGEAPAPQGCCCPHISSPARGTSPTASCAFPALGMEEKRCTDASMGRREGRSSSKQCTPRPVSLSYFHFLVVAYIYIRMRG